MTNGAHHHVSSRPPVNTETTTTRSQKTPQQTAQAVPVGSLPCFFLPETHVNHAQPKMMHGQHRAQRPMMMIMAAAPPAKAARGPSCSHSCSGNVASHELQSLIVMRQLNVIPIIERTGVQAPEVNVIWAGKVHAPLVNASEHSWAFMSTSSVHEASL